MKKEITNEEEKMEKKMKEYQRKSAIGTANQYFDSIADSLRRELEDIERKRKHWEKAIANGKYPDGKPLENSLKINEIIWTMHSLQQLNLHHELGARAIAKIAVAFDVDI